MTNKQDMRARHLITFVNLRKTRMYIIMIIDIAGESGTYVIILGVLEHKFGSM